MSRSRATWSTWLFTWALLTVASAPPAVAGPAGWNAGLTVEQFDLQGRSGGSTLAWDLDASVSRAGNSLWLRSEGANEASGPSSHRLELLWGRPASGVAELLLGVRQDAGTLPSRTYAAAGLQSRPDGPLHWDVTGYLGDGSSRADVHVGVRLQGRYHWQLARHWSVRLRTELEYWNEDHERFTAGTGSGPNELRAGLRLGYSGEGRITYYIGGEWLHQLQDTAELTELAGGDSQDLSLVAGVRLVL